MQSQEKRLLPRIQLGQVPHGALTLMLHGQRIDIERLRDISNSGISFMVGRDVAVSERISLLYADPSVKLEVFAHAGTHYTMGVELLSPMMLYAVLPKN